MISSTKCHPMDATVFHCDAICIDECGSMGNKISNLTRSDPFQGDAFYSVLYGKGWLVPGTVFISRMLHKKVGEWDSSLKAEDLDMLLRLSRIAQLVYVDGPLYLSRNVSGGLGKKTHLWADDMIGAVEKHQDYIGINFNKIMAGICGHLSVEFYSQLDIVRAIHYFRKGLKYRYELSNKLLFYIKILLLYIRASPRIIVLNVLPEKGIIYIRKLKFFFVKYRVSLKYFFLQRKIGQK
jgi:hypothetical protein